MVPEVQAVTANKDGQQAHLTDLSKDDTKVPAALVTDNQCFIVPSCFCYSAYNFYA